MTWHPDTPFEYRDQVVTGDARELSKRIPDESVDLVFTDPPYPRKFIGLYGWLAEESGRILKPGGTLIALAGHAHLPEVLDAMRPHLEWSWLLSQVSGHKTCPIFPQRVWASFKPAIVMRRPGPDRRRTFAFDCVRDTPATMDYAKRFHEWGQAEPFFAYYIERWTQEGDAVFDPFAGGGTTCCAAKGTSRHFIASEIDPDIAERARRRVLLTMPPLLLPDPPEWQGELMLEEVS